eukprot:CAMPEP_0116126838 /NCGR_PEP_ID=MMETSP0329-20121206/6535_1 /TAXON_ID=697910 /ORGANISM="Pseudo-nitzschia arenysensis, Strain B593" /LENGTH=199 /DNA_ID=CAMNT_0003620927 /DNA_START=336 /DNA_END=935 /DNA_ORIENTATION=-
MMTPSTTNKRTQVRFGGSEDSSNRSAWKSTNRSFQPPSSVERKPTLGMDTIEKAKADAALVAALDTGSNHETSTKTLTKPSVLKNRSKTAPILKTTTREFYTISPPKMASRSAWSNNETSLVAPCPAQRQKTLEESELKALCTSIAAMADDSRSSFTMDLSTNESRRYRGSSPRNPPSIKEAPTATDVQESDEGGDSRW